MVKLAAAEAQILLLDTEKDHKSILTLRLPTQYEMTLMTSLRHHHSLSYFLREHDTYASRFNI